MYRSLVYRVGAFALGGIVLASTVTACSSSGSSSGSTGSPTTTGTASPGGDAAAVAKAQADLAQYLTAPTKILQTNPLPGPVPKGKKIIFLSEANTPNIVAIATGGIAAAHAIGWQASSITYDPTSPASLQSAFSSALLKHPSVVAVTASDPSTFGASTIAAYKSAGVPIILTAEASTPAGFLGNPGGPGNFTKEGQALADWFVVDSGGKGSALLAHVPAFPVLNIYAAAFNAQVKALCPDCTVKTQDISIPQLLQGQAASVVVAALRKSQSTKYVFFDDGSFAAGINAALNAAGLHGIKIGGGNDQPENTAGIKAGTQNAWIASNSYNLGYSVVDIALRNMLGAPSTTNDVQPFQLLTKENVGTTTTWDYPSDSPAQYLKLWGVPGS
jgi:ribose transport system substrate-binding protein